jgi:hypothetical protein
LATPIEECETLEDSLTLRYRELEWWLGN